MRPRGIADNLRALTANARGVQVLWALAHGQVDAFYAHATRWCWRADVRRALRELSLRCDDDAPYAKLLSVAFWVLLDGPEFVESWARLRALAHSLDGPDIRIGAPLDWEDVDSFYEQSICSVRRRRAA